MKHAGSDALATLAPLLASLRALPGLVERKPGIFYRGGVAFLHFHEDPAGLFADLKAPAGGFERQAVDSAVQQAALLDRVRARLAPPRG